MVKSLLFLIATFPYLCFNNAFALSTKERQCYAKAMQFCAAASWYDKGLSSLLERLYFHLIEGRKLSACQALKELEVIVRGNKDGARNGSFFRRSYRKKESQKNKIIITQVQMKNIEVALKLYRLHNSFYPTTKQGLRALVERPKTDPMPKKWMGPYMDRIPKDAWGNDFVYVSDGKHFTLISPGPDCKVGTKDDIKVEK